MKIGMFDSGIGGLTILYKAIQALPSDYFIYYADTHNVPYGTKTKEQILEFSDSIVDFLVSKKCDVVVIACNTATSVAAEMLRKKYSIPIIGIEPAVKPAVELNKSGRVLVLATPMTVKEKKLNDLITRVDNKHIIDMKALPYLPSYAERGEFDSAEVINYIENELCDVDVSLYSEIVLGCTHFNHYVPVFRKYFNRDVRYIDGTEGTVRNIVKVVNLLRNGNSDELGNVEFYNSGKAADAQAVEFYKSIMNRFATVL